MNERTRLAVATSLATLGLIVALGVGAASVRTDVSAYVLVLAALLLAALTRVAAEPAARSQVSPFDESLRDRPSMPVRPPELVRVERELTLGESSALHFHSRLLPILQSIAEARGGSLDGLDLPPTDDPAAPGVPLRRIKQLVDRLEAM